MTDIGNEKWINIDEAADYLEVKPGTIRDRIRKEEGIPAHKIGKQWKFKCSELDEWVNSGKSAINQRRYRLNDKRLKIEDFFFLLWMRNTGSWVRKSWI